MAKLLGWQKITEAQTLRKGCEVGIPYYWFKCGNGCVESSHSVTGVLVHCQTLSLQVNKIFENSGSLSGVNKDSSLLAYHQLANSN
jgi:hypothetical protein